MPPSDGGRVRTYCVGRAAHPTAPSPRESEGGGRCRRRWSLEPEHVPSLIVMVLGAVVALLLTGASIYLGPHRPTSAKLAPYECGIIPTTPARQRFPVKFYLMAMLFIVFDIETIFLYPWAVQLRALGRFGLIEMFTFIAVLFVGLLYIWRKGALDWD